jgi:hypothetical protein
MNHSYVQARGGIAQIYDDSGDFEKLIELELINVSILEKRQKDGDFELDRTLNEELALSYELIAHSYRNLKDFPNALHFCKKSFETLEIRRWGACQYLTLLATSPQGSRFSEVIALLRLMELKLIDEEGQNRLSEHILCFPYPSEGPGDFFKIVTEAAMEEDCILWLRKAYQTAMAYAKNHVLVIQIKSCLIGINRKFVKDYHAAEPLILDVIEVACLSNRAAEWTFEFLRWTFGCDYGRICTRKAVQAGPGSAKMERSIHDLLRLSTVGLEDEQVFLYLANLQRRNGAVSTFQRTLGPFLIQSCVRTKVQENPELNETGLVNLIHGLVAVGYYDNVFWFLDRVGQQSTPTLSRCEGCGLNAELHRHSAICEYCLDVFCDSCRLNLESHSGFCIPGHSLLKSPSSPTLFRGKDCTIPQAVEMILAE